jgi:hypothetical protein
MTKSLPLSYWSPEKSYTTSSRTATSIYIAAWFRVNVQGGVRGTNGRDGLLWNEGGSCCGGWNKKLLVMAEEKNGRGAQELKVLTVL